MPDELTFYPLDGSPIILPVVGKRLDDSWVFHNTWRADLSRIADEGLQGGSFVVRRGFDFGRDAWIAVRQADLPPFETHKYGGVMALEPRWSPGTSGNDWPCVRAERLVVVDKRGLVLSHLADHRTVGAMAVEQPENDTHMKTHLFTTEPHAGQSMYLLEPEANESVGNALYRLEGDDNTPAGAVVMTGDELDNLCAQWAQYRQQRLDEVLADDLATRAALPDGLTMAERAALVASTFRSDVARHLEETGRHPEDEKVRMSMHFGAGLSVEQRMDASELVGRVCELVRAEHRENPDAPALPFGEVSFSGPRIRLYPKAGVNESFIDLRLMTQPGGEEVQIEVPGDQAFLLQEMVSHISVMNHGAWSVGAEDVKEAVAAAAPSRNDTYNLSKYAAEAAKSYRRDLEEYRKSGGREDTTVRLTLRFESGLDDRQWTNARGLIGQIFHHVNVDSLRDSTEVGLPFGGIDFARDRIHLYQKSGVGEFPAVNLLRTPPAGGEAVNLVLPYDQSFFIQNVISCVSMVTEGAWMIEDLMAVEDPNEATRVEPSISTGDTTPNKSAGRSRR